MRLQRILVVMALAAPLAVATAWAPAAHSKDNGDTLARQSLRRQADTALEAFRRTKAPQVRAIWGKHRVTPRMVAGMSVATKGSTDSARALHFIGQQQGWLRTPTKGLTVARTSRSKARTVVAFSQSLEGIPVVGRTLTVTMDAQKRVIQVVNDLEQIRRFDRGALTESEAVAAAKQAVFGPALKAWAKAKASARLVWVVQRGWALQTWEVTVATGLMQQRVVSVAATDGRVFGIRNPILH